MFTKEIEIRWSDVDANAHLANSAYINYMSHSRVCYFKEYGLPLSKLLKENIGPIIFYEHIHYFKEVFLDDTITIITEALGFSEDGMFFKFEHNLYKDKKHLATCEIFGAWIHSEKRKLRSLPEPYLSRLQDCPKSDRFKVLTIEDLRAIKKRPSDLAQVFWKPNIHQQKLDLQPRS